MRRKVIIQVTQDKYELPIRIASSIAEMCELTGDNESAIKQSIARSNRLVKNGKERKSYRVGMREYRSVELSPEDWKGWLDCYDTM